MRFAILPEMHTLEPARKSDPQPCVSKELRISGPYQCGIRCGTKKTKTSSGGAATIWLRTILVIDVKPMYHEKSCTLVQRSRLTASRIPASHPCPTDRRSVRRESV